MKIKWLDRRVAAYGPYICLCTSEAQYLQALKECGIKSSSDWVGINANATVHHLDNKDGDAVCVVCVKVKGSFSAIEIASLLVHEAVHIWQEHCARIGENRPASEQEAYGIQYISHVLMQAYADQEVSK